MHRARVREGGSGDRRDGGFTEDIALDQAVAKECSMSVH